MQFLSLIKRKIHGGLIRLNGPRTTGVYFISYPKTGNAWSRFLLGKYLQIKCHLTIMPLFESHDFLGRCERYCLGPGIQFTHSPLVWTGQGAEDLHFHNVVKPFSAKKVVLLIRNPLDTMVSHWFDEKYRQKDRYHIGNLTDFMENPDFSLNKYCRFYKLWYESFHKVRGFHLLRYEALKEDTSGQFQDLLRFLEIEIDQAVLETAVTESSFEKMQGLEKSGQGPKYRGSDLDLFGTGDGQNIDSYHVRRGKVGGYVDYLTHREIEHYLSQIAQTDIAWFSRYLKTDSAKSSMPLLGR